MLTLEEMAEGRRQTLEILRDVFGIKGNSIREVMGRDRNLSEKQVGAGDHLDAVKKAARQTRPVDAEKG